MVSHALGHFFIVVKVLDFEEIFNVVSVAVSQEVGDFFKFLESIVRVMLHKHLEYTLNMG